MSGPRFYDGQPVVCVWNKNEWKDIAAWPAGQPVPKKGHRYTVDRSYAHPFYDSLFGVTLREIQESWAYNQDGFAPVTEKTVEEIRREAMRPPQELHEEHEDWLAECQREKENVS